MKVEEVGKGIGLAGLCVEMFHVICDRSYLRPCAQGFMREVQNLSSQELRCLRSCRRQVLRWYSGGRDLIDTAVMRLAGQGTVRGDADVDIVAGCCSRAFGTVKPFLEHVDASSVGSGTGW